MRDRHLVCPNCGAVLAVPPGCSNCMVRCGHCQHRFRLPSRIEVTDDAVARWLTEEQEATEEADVAAAPSRATATATRPPSRAPLAVPAFAAKSAPVASRAPAAPVSATGGKSHSHGTDVLPTVQEPIRVVKIDRAGVLFEFPASRLRESAFRCAMPRQCLRCGARAHLQAHVIIYTPCLIDTYSVGEEHSAGQLVLSDDDARGLNDEQLLDRLPRVPNMPPPVDNPMPYWICDMCSGAGMLLAQFQAGGNSGLCRLLIHNLRRAEEFLLAASGENSFYHQEILRRITSTAENPWDTLPSVIQHRIEGWFKMGFGERFLAYVPDRDHNRTEDGVAGILVSSTRLVYHTLLKHREITAAEPLELQMSSAGTKAILNIKSPSWQVKHMTVDREGLDALRRALSLAKFQAMWH